MLTSCIWCDHFSRDRF